MYLMISVYQNMVYDHTVQSERCNVAKFRPKKLTYIKKYLVATSRQSFS
jgi:hypothetical protein